MDEHIVNKLISVFAIVLKKEEQVERLFVIRNDNGYKVKTLLKGKFFLNLM
jgi:hypothetical protein